MRIKTLVLTGLLAAGMSFVLVACGQAGSTGASANGTQSGSSQASTEAAGSSSAAQMSTEAATSSSNAQGDFYMTEITDDVFERIKGKSFKDDCTNVI